jgi:signal transduction histidine kinase
MNFAKPTPPKHCVIEPAELINKALHEAKAANDPADRSIEVTFGDVPLVEVDSQQVTGALAEVIGNAIQATDAKDGQIDIHAAFDPYSNRVAVVVQDNGSGMDEPTQKRAFDPFFSAKPAGRRRGMGLAKALRWIEASGGSIRLESRLGQGTRILVLLPAAKSETIEPPAQQRKQA